MDIIEFFKKKPCDFWIENGVLYPRGNTTLLLGKSVEPLLKQMSLADVDILTYGNNWYLDGVTRKFKNQWSREILEGSVDRLTQRGNVFSRRNRDINYYYRRPDKPVPLDSDLKKRLVELHTKVARIETELSQIIELTD